MKMTISDKAHENYRAEIDRAAQNPVDFHNSFDRSESIEHHFVRGAWDFSSQVLIPLLGHLKDPERKTALEIGFGAGRLLAGASPHFEKVIGIDVHNQHDLVSDRLNELGLKNFELRGTDGSTIPANDASIDLVYSFIVLQHLGRLEVFKRYLAEIRRVLKSEGFAIIYVGRRSYLSYCTQSPFRYWIDRIIEIMPGVPAYEELDLTNPLEINLTITAPELKRLSRKAGFKILSVFPSRRKSPNEYAQYGSQYGILLRKR